MSIVDFLKDLDKHDQERKSKQEDAENMKIQSELDKKEFLKNFKLHYQNKVIKDLSLIKRHLDERFLFNYDSNVKQQQAKVPDIWLSEVTVDYQNSEGTNHINISIPIICNAIDKKITITASLNIRNAQIQPFFSGTFEQFKSLNIEEFFEKILRKFIL
jgi:hypothetical protein